MNALSAFISVVCLFLVGFFDESVNAAVIDGYFSEGASKFNFSPASLTAFAVVGPKQPGISNVFLLKVWEVFQQRLYS